MFGTDLYIALVLGVVLSLLFTERTGIIPAGLVVPGYLALIFDQPIFIVVILFVSFFTYLIVHFGISGVTFLYRRRKFADMLIFRINLKMILDFYYLVMPFEILEYRGISVIVPGLIANTMEKQGTVITIRSTLLLGGLTFIILSIYYLV